MRFAPGHAALGQTIRVIKGETGWLLAAPETDYEVATIMRVCCIDEQLYAVCRVMVGGRVVGEPLFRLEDLEAEQ